MSALYYLMLSIVLPAGALLGIVIASTVTKEKPERAR